ncbi:hypothetical protein WDU94_013534 [Cyamophila willieti]
MFTPTSVSGVVASYKFQIQKKVLCDANHVGCSEININDVKEVCKGPYTYTSIIKAACVAAECQIDVGMTDPKLGAKVLCTTQGKNLPPGTMASADCVCNINNK